jgi:hypothetical protein
MAELLSLPHQSLSVLDLGAVSCGYDFCPEFRVHPKLIGRDNSLTNDWLRDGMIRQNALGASVLARTVAPAVALIRGETIVRYDSSQYILRMTHQPA